MCIEKTEGQPKEKTNLRTNRTHRNKGHTSELVSVQQRSGEHVHTRYGNIEIPTQLFRKLYEQTSVYNNPLHLKENRERRYG